MRIAIIGAGAVGGYFGARLAAAGEDVHFIARGRTLEALRTDGITLESPVGDLQLDTVSATDDLNDVGPVDAVILGVKAWQVPEVAATLRPLLGADTAVLPLQNGVEASDQIAEAVGRRHALGAVCKIICQVTRPGRLRHFGAIPSITLGELDNRRSERVERLAAALEGAGVKTVIAPDVHVALWEKFLFIVSVSGLGAVTRSTLGVLRSLPETRAMLEQSMREVADVAAANGVHLEEDTVERILGFLDKLPEETTASMQRDIMEGRPSELESQNGAVVRLGKKVGVATPLNHFLYYSLLPMEQAARS